METYMIAVLFVVLSTAQGEANAKSKSSSDSKAESYVPVMEIHPPFVSLPHPGIYPPGFSAPIPPQHLEIFHQPQYGHVGEITKGKHEVKNDFKLVQQHKETERKGKQLNVSKVKKVYTDGRGGIRTKTEKLYSDGHGAIEKGHLHGVQNKGFLGEQIQSHYLPYFFPGGHNQFYGHGYSLPHPYHFQGLGLAGQYGNFLAPHSFGHHGYGFPAFGPAAIHTDHSIVHPGIYPGPAQTHTVIEQTKKNPIEGKVTHGIAHVHSGPGQLATAVGHGIGNIHAPLHLTNPIAHITGPFLHGFPQAAGPLGVHAGPLLNGLSPGIGHGGAPGYA